MPVAINSPHLSHHRGRPAGKVRDAIAEGGKSRIVGLTLDEAVIDLLNHDRDFEKGEDFEVAQRRNVAAAPGGVALDDLVAGEPAGRPVTVVSASFIPDGTDGTQ